MWKRLLKSLRLSESYISMGLGLLVVLVIGVLLFNFFSSRGKSGTPKEGAKTEEKKEEAKSTSLPTTHNVAEGESLWVISEKYFNSGYNWVDIAKENNLSNPDYLEVGQTLTIPKAEPILPVTGTNEAVSSPITGTSYTVVEGDNLWDIAVRAYSDGYQWPKIAQTNNLANSDLIYTGTVLTLPR